MPDGPNKNIPQPVITGSMQPEVVRRPTRLVIDAPIYLAFRQNLYDQEPFTGVIQGLQERLGFAGEGYAMLFRRLLTESLDNSDFVASKRSQPQSESALKLAQEDVMFNLRAKRVFSSRASCGRVRVDQMPRVALHTAKALLYLLGYPAIDEYLQGQTLERLVYDRFGEFVFRQGERVYQQFPTRTYPKWLYDCAQRKSLMMSLEVRALIFGDESSSVAAVGLSGHKRNWNRWEIVKAAELSRRLPVRK